MENPSNWFQPGNTLGKGRPPGSPNKRTEELRRRLAERGDTDPADYLSSVVTDPKESPELKVQAANNLLPYLYSKRGAMPPPRFVETPIEVPEFTSIEIAESFLAKIATLVAGGELDIQTGLELSQLTKAWIDSRHAAKELDLKIINVEGGPREQTIRIEGGLPALPGTNITMPVLDGHAVTNGHALEPPVPQIESSPPSESTNGSGEPPETQGRGST